MVNAGLIIAAPRLLETFAADAFSYVTRYVLHLKTL